MDRVLFAKRTGSTVGRVRKNLCPQTASINQLCTAVPPFMLPAGWCPLSFMHLVPHQASRTTVEREALSLLPGQFDPSLTSNVIVAFLALGWLADNLSICLHGNKWIGGKTIDLCLIVLSHRSPICHGQSCNHAARTNDPSNE